MEVIKNKKGIITSYREKVYVHGKSYTRSFKRKSDAKAWKISTKARIQKNKALGITKKDPVKFGDYSRSWIETKKNQNLSQRTIDNYMAVMRKYLLPLFDNIMIDKIGASEGNCLIKRGKENGLGPTRINFNLRVLKQILKSAYEEDYLAVMPLKGFKNIQEIKRDISYWMPNEVEAFLKANQEDSLFPLYKLMLNTGLRPGEAFGLKWDKVDFFEKRINVTRTRDRYGLKETTKTKTGRVIPLNEEALKLLTDLKENSKEDSYGYVIVQQCGSIPCIRHVSGRNFKKAIENANVKRIRLHDLRVTYASNFVMQGGSIFALSKLLGHSSVEMTAKRYAALDQSYLSSTTSVVNF